MGECFQGSVSALSDLWSPFVTGLWCEPMTKEAVKWCLDRGWLLSPDDGADTPFTTQYYLAHAARIAWFVTHGFDGGVTIEVSMTRVRWHPVRDGNHRLAAAIYRGDTTIPVQWINGPIPVLLLLQEVDEDLSDNDEMARYIRRRKIMHQWEV